MDNVYSEVAELRKDIADVKSELRDIRNALLGDDYDRTGLAATLGNVVRSEASMKSELHAIRTDQERRRRATESRRRVAYVILVAVMVAAWILSTILIQDLRHAAGIGAQEARFVATILLVVVMIAGGFIGAVWGSVE